MLWRKALTYYTEVQKGMTPMDGIWQYIAYLHELLSFDEINHKSTPSLDIKWQNYTLCNNKKLKTTQMSINSWLLG